MRKAILTTNEYYLVVNEVETLLKLTKQACKRSPVNLVKCATCTEAHQRVSYH